MRRPAGKFEVAERGAAFRGRVRRRGGVIFPERVQVFLLAGAKRRDREAGWRGMGIEARWMRPGG
jgi:hypothetical protein